MNSPVDRLRELRAEVESLDPIPWSNIEHWIAKANPIIRKDWAAYLDDFGSVAGTPQWTALPVTLGRDKSKNDATIRRTKEIGEKANRAEAGRAKERIISFLDGLLAVSDDEPVNENVEEPVALNNAAADRRNVFVIHGRNTKARDSLFTFLRAINLRPLEWSEIVQATGKGSPYVGEVLETGFNLAQAIVVLLTPDDEARLDPALQQENDEEYESRLSRQPRPNVLIEAGMALGKCASRTVIVECGKLRPSSDLLGRHVIRMNNTVARRQDLADRLEAARCEVSLRGRDWHQAGEFEACIPNATTYVNAQADDLVFADGAYYEKDSEGNPTGRPYCPTCLEHDGKRLHLTHAGPPFPYECQKCGAHIQCKDDDSPGFAISSGPL